MLPVRLPFAMAVVEPTTDYRHLAVFVYENLRHGVVCGTEMMQWGVGVGVDVIL